MSNFNTIKGDFKGVTFSTIPRAPDEKSEAKEDGIM